jgi:hypothetical protein
MNKGAAMLAILWSRSIGREDYKRIAGRVLLGYESINGLVGFIRLLGLIGWGVVSGLWAVGGVKCLEVLTSLFV